MVEGQNQSWRKRFAIGTIVGGLLFGSATHKNQIKPVFIDKINAANTQSTISSEIIFIQDFHKTFSKNSFYTDAPKVGINGLEFDFQFILDTIHLEKITDKDIKQLVTSLKLIVKQSKELNFKYKYLKSINSNEISDLDEKIEFYNQFEEKKELTNYISAIQSLIKKKLKSLSNADLNKFGDSTLIYLDNLHAFVGIRKN